MQNWPEWGGFVVYRNSIILLCKKFYISELCVGWACADCVSSSSAWIFCPFDFLTSRFTNFKNKKNYLSLKFVNLKNCTLQERVTKSKAQAEKVSCCSYIGTL